MSIEPASPMRQISTAQVEKLISSIQYQAAATLAAAVINARGKPLSVQEALEIAHTVHMAMVPPPLGTGIGAKWAKEKDAKLTKVWE